MLTSVQDFKNAACALLIQISEGSFYLHNTDIPQPDLNNLLAYIAYENFATGIEGGRLSSGEFYVSPASSPRVTKKGMAFIRSMEK